MGNFNVAFVVAVLRVVWQRLLFFVDALDGETLAGGMGSAYLTVEFINSLNFDSEVGLPWRVVLIGAIIISANFSLYLALGAWQRVAGGTGRRDHWFIGVADAVG